jgi:hypothetical protein
LWDRGLDVNGLQNSYPGKRKGVSIRDFNCLEYGGLRRFGLFFSFLECGGPMPL